MLKYATDRLIQHLFVFLLGLLLLNSMAAYAGNDGLKTEGEIQSIGPDSLVVNNFIFDVDSYTVIKGEEGDLYFGDLAVGDYVKVEGQLISTDRYHADKIERKGKNGGDDKEHEMETKGYISKISASSIDVNGYTFEITTNTTILDHNGTNIVFEQLQTGMLVEVKGSSGQDGSLYAAEIKLEDMHSESEIEFYGHIDSVLTDAIVINQKNIMVTNTTVIMLHNHQLGTFGDLTVGQFVEVKAAINNTGNFLAVRIKLEDNPESEIEIIGRIDSLGIGFIEMLEYRVEIDDNTIIMNYERALLTQADLEKGQRVEVKGNLVADHIMQASRIKVKRFHENEMEFTGQVTMVSSSQIQVDQTLFNVTKTTILLNNQNQPLTLNLFQVGQFVEIKGIFENDGSITALRIKLEDRGQDEVEFTGRIEALTEDQVSVSGITFFVNNNTIVLDLLSNSIVLSDLNVNDRVEIKGLIQTDGSILAMQIKLEDTPGLIVVSGEITSKNNNGMEISGPVFTIDDFSILLDKNYNVTTLDNFTPGEQVTVWAMQKATGKAIIQAKLDNTGSVTSTIDNRVSLPQAIQLHANYPNPFNPETNITFTLNKDGFRRVELAVYDITGRQIRILYNGLLDQGNYSFKWNGQNENRKSVASGMYIYLLRSGDVVLTRKMTLIR